MLGDNITNFENQQGFEALFHNATVGILLVNAEGIIEVANSRVSNLFGYSHSELSGQPIEILMPQAFRQNYVHKRNDFFKNSKTRPLGYGLSILARKKHGLEFRVEISLGHYKLNDKNMAVAFVIDVTDRINTFEILETNIAKRNLQLNHSFTDKKVRIASRSKIVTNPTHDFSTPNDNKSHDVLKMAFNVAQYSSAMLAYWDRNLICRFANIAYLEWFGLAPEVMIDKMLLKTVLGYLYEKNLVHINAVLNGKTQIFERTIVTTLGVTKFARTIYTPDIIDGVVKGFYDQVFDISPLENQDNILQNTLSEMPVYMHLSFQLLNEVVQTLKSCVITGFPGITVLSKKHFISESKLKRDFKKKYNTTIFSFYRNLQMEFAFGYLQNKQCNLKQMAAILKFSNASNFSACYKKYLKDTERASYKRSINAL